MKLLQIGSLILAAAGAMAQSGCINEMEKVAPCMSSIQIETAPELKSIESVKEFCGKFDVDQCKDFISNAGSVISDCDLADANNKGMATLIYTLRVAYLTYCAKDTSGNLCPLTQLIIDTAAKGSNNFEYDDEAKKVFIEDCKIDECNARLVGLADVVGELNKSTGSNDTIGYTPVIDAYKNKKCDDIKNVKTDAAGSIAGTAGTVDSNTDTTTDDDKNSGSEAVKKFTLGLTLVSLLAALFLY